MLQVLNNIILFLKEPKKLFTKLKEKPDLKGSLSILGFMIFLYLIWGLKAGDIKLTPANPMLFVWSFALIGFTSILIVGVIYTSLYFLLFCRIFGKKIGISSILSAVIYCSIPALLNIITHIFYPVNLSLDALLNINGIHPFFNIFLKRMEVFELWTTIMEVVAIKVFTEASYKKSTAIVFLFWFINMLLTYKLGYKSG